MTITHDPAWAARPQRAGDEAHIDGWTSQAGRHMSGMPRAGDVGLVLVDNNDRPQACLRLRMRLGLERPRYHYCVGSVVHAAPELRLFSAQKTLLLGNDHTGQSEITDLACAPGSSAATRVQGMEVLLREALAQWALRRPSSVERLVVEIAGLRDSRGASPFWEGLGRHFYAGEPDEAYGRFGEDWCGHLASLLPRQPLYLSFLNEAAQSALGRVGVHGAAAAQALHACGLRFVQHVRIDDGGPVMALLT